MYKIEKDLDSFFTSDKLRKELDDKGYTLTSSNCSEACDYVMSLLTDEERSKCQKIGNFALFDKDEMIGISGHFVIKYNDKLYGFTDDQYCEMWNVKPYGKTRVYEPIGEDKYQCGDLTIQL